ncbi:hypothetical protein JOC55_006442 [Paenibacillus sacheonensis]|nr:hypothetical protein [Paenibacillus sacheonensis]
MENRAAAPLYQLGNCTFWLEAQQRKQAKIFSSSSTSIVTNPWFQTPKTLPIKKEP